MGSMDVESGWRYDEILKRRESCQNDTVESSQDDIMTGETSDEDERSVDPNASKSPMSDDDMSTDSGATLRMAGEDPPTKAPKATRVATCLPKHMPTDPLPRPSDSENEDDEEDCMFGVLFMGPWAMLHKRCKCGAPLGYPLPGAISSLTILICICRFTSSAFHYRYP